MKNLILLTIVFVFASCTRGVKYDRDKQVSEYTSIDRFLNDFENTNPNWLQNSIIEERTNKDFEKKLDSFLRTPDALNGYSFELEGINEYATGKYATKLIYDEQDKNIEIIGLIDTSLVSELKEGKRYAVDGKYLQTLETPNPYFDFGLWNLKKGKDKLIDTADVYFGVSLYEIENLQQAPE